MKALALNITSKRRIMPEDCKGRPWHHTQFYWWEI